MLEDPQIVKLMREVAAGIFPAKDLLAVKSDPVSDEYGVDALDITLLLTDQVAEQLTGDQLISLLREMHDSLLERGDERFPHLSFRTPADPGAVDFSV